MARSGGTYSLPEAAFVSGTVIDETKVNSDLSDIAAALTQSVSKDGQTTMTGNLPMGSTKLTSLAVGTAATDSVNLVQVQTGVLNYAIDTGTGTAYAVALSPSVTVVSGMSVRFKAVNANSGAAPTLAINGGTAYAITWPSGAALVAGNIAANSNVEVIYNLATTSWHLQALPSLAGLLQAAVTNTVSVGFGVTPYSAGTKSSGTFTPDPANGNYQYATNGGAHTLAAPTSDCGLVIYYLNNASAGAITFSGFTVGSSTGDALTTTNTNKFMIQILRINSVATYVVKSLQ